MMAAIEAAATHSNWARPILVILVMAGLDPAIHEFGVANKDVDAWDSPWITVRRPRARLDHDEKRKTSSQAIPLPCKGGRDSFLAA
jgi:hypothetical protein